MESPAPGRGSTTLTRSRDRHRDPRRPWLRAAALCGALVLVFIAIEGLQRLGAAGAGAGSGTGGPVVVIRGHVDRPGVTALGPGERVGDVIQRAGGDLSTIPEALLQLPARPFTVIEVGEGGDLLVLDIEPPELFAIGGRLDPNDAAADALREVPGISETLARRIVEQREDQPFCSVDDLVRVRGIGPAKMETARPFLVVSVPRTGCPSSP